MRDRLIHLISAGLLTATLPNVKAVTQQVADYLLASGVIVPPCKVGDTVWYLNKHPHISLLQNSVYKATVARIVTISTGTVLVIQIKSEGCCEIPDETDWGITVFATREEAEQALKGGANE